MKTKRGRQANEKNESASAEQAPLSAPVIDAESDKKNNDRISFYIDENGIPQWDRLSPRTTEQLKVIFGNKDSQAKLGFVPPTVKEVYEQGFDETEANALLDLLQIIKAAAASKMFEVPHEITSRAFTDTELQRSKQVKPITKLLNKWGPSLLKTWKDEIGAGIVFVSVTNAQVQMMKHLDAQRKKSQPQPVREIPNRNVSAGAEKKPEEKKEPPEENPVLEALNASA